MAQNNVVRMRSNRRPAATVTSPSFDVEGLIAELDGIGANSNSHSYTPSIDTYVTARGRLAA